MLKIKMSSKRQATFPKHVCDALGIQPGDDILLDRINEADREVWFMKPVKEHARPWFGCLSDYACGKDHEMKTIRKSIAAGRSSDKS